MAISVVINNYQEADELVGCLDSVAGWVDEMVIVDMESSAEIKKLAEKYKAKVYPHAHLDYVEPARNFGIEKAKGDWVLVLDPDERVTSELAGKLRQVASENQAEVVKIPRKNIIFGKWIKHSNWWPDYHARFFKKGSLTWTKEIHAVLERKGSLQTSGRIISLAPRENLALEHHNYETVNQFLERQNRYSSVSAHNRFEAGEKFSSFNLVWHPSRLFLQRFFRHLGFLDGFYGLALAILVAYSQLAEEVKLWELERTK